MTQNVGGHGPNRSQSPRQALCQKLLTKLMPGLLNQLRRLPKLSKHLMIRSYSGLTVFL